MKSTPRPHPAAAATSDSGSVRLPGFIRARTRVPLDPHQHDNLPFSRADPPLQLVFLTANLRSAALLPVMLYLADVAHSFGFLYSVACFLLPQECDISTSPDPPPMDPKPPDRTTIPTPPHPPSLEAFHVPSRAAPRSIRQDEQQVVADPQGTAMESPIHATRLALQIAWKDSYKPVSEMQGNLFRHSFDNNLSMLFALKTKLWILWHHNLLLQIAEPHKNSLDYCFPYMHVTVQLLGIPTEPTDTQQIGQPVHLEQLSSSSIFHDVWFKAALPKINVTRPSQDKVFVPISEKGTNTASIHLEKVMSISIFCEGYLHNA